MPKIVYSVAKIDEEWRVVCGERKIGHFARHDEALFVAAGLVREALAAGLQAELALRTVVETWWKAGPSARSFTAQPSSPPPSARRELAPAEVTYIG